MRQVMTMTVGVTALIGIGAAAYLAGSFTSQGSASSQTQEQVALSTALHVTTSPSVEAGRYLVVVGGCNDCHTVGWNQTPEQIPEDQWLLGSPMGFRGPWGTTYASNLRRFLENMPEDDWVHFAKTWRARPPMPSFNVNQMSEEDLRSIYRFIRSLGAQGELAPAFLPPEQEPTTPFIVFEPQQP